MSRSMMRWAAAALLLLNLAYYWYATNEVQPEPKEPVVALGAKQLVLLSERPVETPQSRPASEEGAVPAVSQSPLVVGNQAANQVDAIPVANAAPQEPLRCWELGPLDATLQADLAGLFERIALPMRSFEREEVNAASHRVYLAITDPGQTQEYERKLLEAGMESYIIGGGELEGDLSLGLYTSRERAEAVAAPLQELDLPVIIHTRQRSQNRTWLRVDSREVKALGWSADLADLTLWPRPGIQAVDCEAEFAAPVPQISEPFQ